ncbi:MAG: copper chaperone [Flavobacteriales bacterium]
MKSSTLFLLLPMAVLFGSCGSIDNAATTTVLINGNCSMCEETIEGAALVEGLSMADWDKTTRKAVLTYDSTRTDARALLQRIANVGYDSQEFVADDAAYENLPMCCQYDRTGTAIATPDPKDARKHH